MNYRDSTQAAALITSLTGLTPMDLDALLTVSAGKDADGLDVFRPYFVAAWLLGRRDNTSKVLRAGDVHFDEHDKTVLSYLTLQAALDAALGLVVPVGMEAVIVRNDTLTPVF